MGKPDRSTQQTLLVLMDRADRADRSPSITVAGSVITASNGAYVYNHQTLSAGGPAITVFGTTYNGTARLNLDIDHKDHRKVFNILYSHSHLINILVHIEGDFIQLEFFCHDWQVIFNQFNGSGLANRFDELSLIFSHFGKLDFLFHHFDECDLFFSHFDKFGLTLNRLNSSCLVFNCFVQRGLLVECFNELDLLLNCFVQHCLLLHGFFQCCFLFNLFIQCYFLFSRLDEPDLLFFHAFCFHNNIHRSRHSLRWKLCSIQDRMYWFDLIEVTVAPDGIERAAMTVNGSIPGPTIEANWGDTVKLHVTNSLTSNKNGTSIHFHGLRMNYTNQMDGVVSITQCPTAPGENYTYTWKAEQYGTTWYHSHFALQAWEGVFGGIKINGPATANYDTDVGHIFLNDWSHETSSSLEIVSETRGPPTLENALINGTNVYNNSGTVTGSRFETTFEAGKSHRLRLVNGAIDTHFKFSVDNHTMQVIANDLVPIVPYNTTVLNIGMGQRYDVIITADQGAVASDFWMRAIPQTACSNNASPDNIKGIVRYSTSTSADDPSTTGYDYTNECVDEDVSDLVPWVVKNAASGTSLPEAVALGRNSDNLNRWMMNSTSMVVEWNDPSLLQVYNNDSDFTDTSGVVRLDTADEWVMFVIETAMPIPHPIHLHGHDFNILAQGTGTYDSSVTLNLSNPPRRDVALLPSAGYLVIAFATDNPGAWLMHCHIGWHTSEGFAIQIIERWDEVSPLIDHDTLESNCNAWDAYVDANSVVQDDSGV
ncbi:putative multicopper oxidase protein [Botryosphaeria dothidea]|uniref:laccase n=1 Tax=Botryosphaeria dothidea TaxID=55169 RepID=A0A8H4J1U4_9PEZI|nr:putative multicopper oxidase protein [Botryosphaeria dothidea]